MDHKPQLLKYFTKTDGSMKALKIRNASDMSKSKKK